MGTQQLLPYMAWHPPSTWGVEVVDVETRAGHDVRHFLELQRHTEPPCFTKTWLPRDIINLSQDLALSYLTLSLPSPYFSHTQGN